MKLVIGITQYPEKIPEFIKRHRGRQGSETEVGPFLSRKDAISWRECLKEKIVAMEEIAVEHNYLKEALYYGFTFECED